MTPDCRISRRALLRWLLLAAPLGGLAIAGLGRGARDRRPATEFGRALAELLPDRESAAVVGSAYLERHPGEADASRLLGLLSRSLPPPGSPGRGDEESLAAALRRRIRRDFEEENVVRVRGWLLARAEARLCALSTLI